MVKEHLFHLSTKVFCMVIFGGLILAVPSLDAKKVGSHEINGNGDSSSDSSFSHEGKPSLEGRPSLKEKPQVDPKPQKDQKSHLDQKPKLDQKPYLDQKPHKDPNSKLDQKHRLDQKSKLDQKHRSDQKSKLDQKHRSDHKPKTPHSFSDSRPDQTTPGTVPAIGTLDFGEKMKKIHDIIELRKAKRAEKRVAKKLSLAEMRAASEKFRQVNGN